MRVLLLALTTVALLGVGPAVALADSNPPGLEELVVGMADTPADHEALAKYYRAKAIGLRKEASMHRDMGKRYSSGNMATRAAMRKHCDEIAGYDEKIAAQYDALAEGHEAQAKKK